MPKTRIPQRKLETKNQQKINFDDFSTRIDGIGKGKTVSFSKRSKTAKN